MAIYKEFKIDDLFDKLDLKRLKPTFDKKSDLSKVQTEEFYLPLVNAKAGNNGIMYYGRSGDWESETMTIDIVNDGAVSAGMVYAQPQATGTLYNAYQIKVKSDVFSDLTVPHLLFLATVIQKSIQHKYNYSNKAVWSKVSSELIQLPVKQGTDDVNYSEADIDWDYMEAYIREIELSYIAELKEARDFEFDACLQETGLNDTRLTDEEQNILSAKPTYGEFKVEDLFDKLDLKRIKPTFDKKSDLSKVQTEEFDLPLVNAKAGNNGIMYYGRSGDWESETMTIDIVNDGAVSAGMVYAQPQTTGTLYNAYQIKLKAEVLSEVTVPHLLFLATTIQKSIQHKYNYSNKAVWSKVSSELIKLPLKPGTTTYSEADIDWDYMEAYIRAIEKQVIANVVTYKDTFIAKAKEIVN